MQISRITLLLAVMALALVGPAAGEPCPPAAVAPVDLGNTDLGFAEVGPRVFEGSGIGGRVRVSTAGLEIASNAVDGVANAVDLHLALTGAVIDPGGDGGSSGSALIIGPSGIETQLATWDRLIAAEVYPGIDLTVEASQRRVNLIFSGPPEAFARVGVTLPGAEAIRIDQVSGALVAALPVVPGGTGRPAGELRASIVELVALDDAGRRLEAAFELDGEGGVGIRLDEAAAGTVEVVLTTLYSPHVEPADVADLAGGGRVAVGATRAGARSARRQGFIAELDAEGRRVVRMTTLDLGTDLTLEGVAVDRSGGRILVAGRRGSGLEDTVFLAAIENRGEEFSISPAFGEVVSGVAHDVEISADGTVLLTGKAGPAFTTVGTEAARFTVALPASAVTPERLFVAAVEPDLERLVYATELAVPATARRLRAWIDCHGELVVGLPWTPKELMMATHTYSMSIPSSDMLGCPEVDTGWGYLAMCWKWLKKIATFTYHPENVPASNFPVLIVDNPDPAGFDADYQRLNQLEANDHGNLFFDTVSGEWADPGGGWGAEDNWAYSREEIALAAAIYHERWTSPVFANFRLADGGNPPTPLAVMMRAETFSADSDGDLPHNACNEDTDGDGHSDWSDDPYPLPPEHQVAAACASAHGSQFELESVDYDAWLGGAYTPDQTVSGDDPSWWPWVSAYVGDPPEPGDEDQMTAAHVLEMSRRLRAQARTTVDLALTPVEGGVAQAPTILCAQVASQDLSAESE